MRVKLLVTTGLVTGFMLGSWTPLGELGSWDAVSGLLNARHVEASTQIASLGRFRSLIAAARTEPSGNILQNREIVLAAGFFDPEDAWAMKFAELAALAKPSRTGAVAMASWPGQTGTLSPEGRQNANAGASHAGSVMAVPDRDAWYSQTNELELARLRATIAGIEAENLDIEANLASLDPAHPDHYMARCIFESNEALVSFYSFLTIMGEQGATLDDAAHLAGVLDEQRRQTYEHGKTGRAEATDYARVLENLPAVTPADQRIKSKSLEYYESFVLSFNLEDTLAAHLAAYPALIENAIATGEPPRGVSQWVADFQELGRARMELQAYRQQIAQELAGPSV